MTIPWAAWQQAREVVALRVVAQFRLGIDETSHQAAQHVVEGEHTQIVPTIGDQPHVDPGPSHQLQHLRQGGIGRDLQHRTNQQGRECQLATLRVDGGASQNDFLMQFQADVLGAPVERPQVLEVTAMGAAALAGLATGFWTDRDGLRSALGAPTVFEPQLDASARDALYADWTRAVARSREWIEP